MRKSVSAAWPAFNADLEGVVSHMYLDRKGLVTTGMGNLIDPLGEYVYLPWSHADGSLATIQEVRAAWATVKAAQDLAPLGGNHARQRALTSLRLPPHAVDVLIRKKLHANDEALQDRFEAFRQWPAAAQMALHSMAWAMGPAFADGGRWPKFRAAASKEDFLACSRESKMGPQEGTIITRNRRNAFLFNYAASEACEPDSLPDWKLADDDDTWDVR